jgi:hypothetical protein
VTQSGSTLPVSLSRKVCLGILNCNAAFLRYLLLKKAALQEEEEKIVQHVKTMTSYEYGYMRHDVTDIATDYAHTINRQPRNEVCKISHISFLMQQHVTYVHQEAKVLGHHFCLV